MRFKKVYVEITNICNLSCAFCPGTARKKSSMTSEDFRTVLKKLRPFTDYIYPHVMGEPLFHPDFPLFLDIAEEYGFKVVITTNGTLLGERGDAIISSPAVKRVNISLHSFEAANLKKTVCEYLEGCMLFAKKAEGGKIISLRLWNKGGMDNENGNIVAEIKKYFPQEWKESRNGLIIGNNVYIDYGIKFDWPDIDGERSGGNVFCYGLRDQIGVLCDGTVIPCCLDRNGDIALGNIYAEELDDILRKPRAQAIYNGFSARRATEELCGKCGYAKRFS